MTNGKCFVQRSSTSRRLPLRYTLPLHPTPWFLVLGINTQVSHQERIDIRVLLELFRRAAGSVTRLCVDTN